MSTIDAPGTAVISGSFLSGTMMSLSLIAIPVLLDTTTQAPQLFHQWVRMYHYGHQVLPTMAVATFSLYSYTSIRRRSAKKSWGVFALAGVTTLAMLPFTWLFMVPTNNELFRLEEVSKVEPSGLEVAEAKMLVMRWGWLHFARSLLPLAGALLGSLAR